MKQHEENARVLAQFLAGHPKLMRVNYPGLPDHPQHELAKRQARGFGALISFDTGSIERADQVLRAVKLFTLAESLGGVESLISHPATMTHGSVPAADKIKLGVTPGLVRISVGIEDVEDLRADLEQALS
jgi:cystathionine beta-lyase/cystathionine gamma-synthase